MRLKLSIGDKRYETEIDFRPNNPREDQETLIYELREKAGGFIANTVRMHYGIGVMKEMEVVGGDFVADHRLVEKEPRYIPTQTIHKYADGNCYVDGKQISWIIYNDMTAMGARVENHPYGYSQTTNKIDEQREGR